MAQTASHHAFYGKIQINWVHTTNIPHSGKWAPLFVVYFLMLINIFRCNVLSATYIPLLLKKKKLHSSTRVRTTKPVRLIKSF